MNGNQLDSADALGIMYCALTFQNQFYLYGMSEVLKMSQSPNGEKCSMQQVMYFDNQINSPLCETGESVTPGSEKIDIKRRCASANDKIYACQCDTGFNCRSSQLPTTNFTVSEMTNTIIFSLVD